jgi:hypothetical protein
MKIILQLSYVWKNLRLIFLKNKLCLTNVPKVNQSVFWTENLLDGISYCNLQYNFSFSIAGDKLDIMKMKKLTTI